MLFPSQHSAWLWSNTFSLEVLEYFDCHEFVRQWEVTVKIQRAQFALRSMSGI